MSGRESREKGRRTELALVHLLQKLGFAAEKTSRTGYSGWIKGLFRRLARARRLPQVAVLLVAEVGTIVAAAG
jgi:hypothetical protein